MDISDLNSLVLWLTTSGGAVILVGWAAAWYLEPLAWWKKIGGNNRLLIILGMSLVLGILSTWVQTQPALIEALAPYFRTVIAIVGVWLTTQVAHRLDTNTDTQK